MPKKPRAKKTPPPRAGEMRVVSETVGEPVVEPFVDDDGESKPRPGLNPAMLCGPRTTGVRPVTANTENPDSLERALAEVRDEVHRAAGLHAPYHSLHEALAVVHEEFDELKAEVWKKRKDRRLNDVRTEAVQLACTAVRLAAGLADPAARLDETLEPPRAVFDTAFEGMGLSIAVGLHKPGDGYAVTVASHRAFDVDLDLIVSTLHRLGSTRIRLDWDPPKAWESGLQDETLMITFAWGQPRSSAGGNG